MGVAGLWDVIKPAGTVRSLTHLAVKDGFEANPDGKRGYRLGIDASIWFFHAEYGREGENPVLRTLFFRCATLMHTTFLPLFVFDGPKRPDVKRGKKINRTSHKLIPGMKQIVEAFGFEWRMAPGEAEAELAYLNRIGVIDGILSDDVDNFLFGAKTVIRNSSNTLSGNRANPILNSAGKDDKNHSRIFSIDTITNHEDIKLTRGGMILIGLMSGGDYQQGGLARCGVTTAHALARCGFGDSLFEAAMNLDRVTLEDFLASWREEVRDELRTNSKGEVRRKQVALANSITRKFPDIDVLLSYVKPITSESMGRASNNLLITWDKEPDLAKLAGVCEFYFEWGYKEAIVKRFRTVIWHSVVLRILRRAVLDLDQGKSRTDVPTTPKKKDTPARTPCGTPSKMIAKHFSSLGINSPTRVYLSGSESDEGEEEEHLIVKVHACRQHTSTDELPEYRLEISPKQLVRLTESGIKGLRVPEGQDEWASEEVEDDEDVVKKGRKVPIDPQTHLRVWMPACMVKLVEPQLVENYEGQQERKRLKKATKGTRNASSKGKASTKKKKDTEDVFSAQPKKPNTKKPMTTKAASKFSLPSLGDETSNESENPQDFVFPILPERVDQKTRRQSPPEGDSYEPDLRRQEGNIGAKGATEDFHAGSSEHLVKDISSALVKPRTRIRDLTKNKKQATASNIKSFFPVTHSSSIITKRPPLSTSRDEGSEVPCSPSKRKSRERDGSSEETGRGDISKKSPRKRFTERTRTVSPSPSKPIVKKGMKVIEISSDSHSDEPEGQSITLCPLLRARARAMSSRQSSTKTNPSKSRISSDIIDLT